MVRAHDPLGLAIISATVPKMEAARKPGRPKTIMMPTSSSAERFPPARPRTSTIAVINAASPAMARAAKIQASVRPLRD